MKIRGFTHSLLFLGTISLLCGGGCRQLWAGQTYQRHVTVFGNSSAASTSPQKVDPATEADIRELMDLAGTKATVTRVMNNMVDNMRPLFLRALPPGPYRKRLVQLFFEKIHTKMEPQHILDLAVPIYAKYFSDAEIKQVIQFYKTPLGQKWVRLLPKMQAQIMPEAQRWGQQTGRETMIEVLQEHPDLAQQLKAAEEAAHRHSAGR